MRRKRLNERIGTAILAETREALERISDKKLVSLSELTRQYIEEGISREEMPC